MVLRPIICTVILIVNCIFWFSYVPRKIKALLEKLEKEGGVSPSNSHIFHDERDKYLDISFLSAGLAMLSFGLNGIKKPALLMTILFLIIMLIGVVVMLKLRSYYNQLAEKYRFKIREPSATQNIRVRALNALGIEGVHGSIVVRLTISHFVFLILQYAF